MGKPAGAHHCAALILRDEGPINGALQSIGLTDGPLPLAYNNFAIGLGLVSSFLPFMILPLYTAIRDIRLALLEAAHDLGAPRQAFLRRVLIPICGQAVASRRGRFWSSSPASGRS